MSARADSLPATDPPPGRQRLVVVTAQGFAVHALPEQGAVTLGRGPAARLRIDDPTVGDLHATLDVGPRSLLQDLGSGCVTRVREQQLAPLESVEVGPGDLIQLGGVTVLLEWRSGPPHRRILTDDYFELRVEEECNRAERSRSTFAVLGVQLEGAEAAQAEELLAGMLRLTDVIALHVPGSYEVLLPETPPGHVSTIVSRLGARIEEARLQGRIGVASYPTDGRSADLLLEKARLAPGRPEAAPQEPSPDLNSPAQVAYRMAELVAPTEINVLIVGETGVGKERFAALVHSRSARAGKPFIGLNCAALSESLLESELFGHERGAFTGAQQAKPGLLEMASGGTVLLDEIGEMQLSVQGKLLRVIEERTMRRVGGLREIPIDVRFISATNRDLEAEIARGVFRADLFFRLNGLTLAVPPLRDRVAEIEPLARQFARETAERMHRPAPPDLSEEVLRLFRSYSWPGNIRELRNVVERAVVLCGAGPIGAAHVPEGKMRASLAPRRPVAAPARGPAAEPLLRAQPPEQALPRERAPGERRGPGRLVSDELQRRIRDEEREQIVDALSRCAGNQTEAARLLGVSRRTLVKRLAEYEIPRPRRR